MRRFTVIDLFAGVGGISIGFMRANENAQRFGFTVKLLVDFDPTAAFTFKKNFPQIPFWRNDLALVEGPEVLKLINLEVGELDFLVGGPPCQGFSPNGKRWIEDNRNKLIARFIRIVDETQPKCAIVENVPAAVGSYEKLFNQEIQEAFEGYVVKVGVLNATTFGVPQIRKRAFIVALRKDLGISDFTFPSGEFDGVEVGNNSHTLSREDFRFVSVRDAIGDLPSIRAGESIDGARYTSKAESDYQVARRRNALAIFNHVARSHSENFLMKISPIKPGKGNRQLPDSERFSDNYFSQAYSRLHPDGVGFTITAHFRNPGSGRFTHYRDNRSITVREAARLQSFDDRFIFHGYETDQQRHVGNAVPPLVAEALAEHFGNILCSP